MTAPKPTASRVFIVLGTVGLGVLFYRVLPINDGKSEYTVATAVVTPVGMRRASVPVSRRSESVDADASSPLDRGVVDGGVVISRVDGLLVDATTEDSKVVGPPLGVRSCERDAECPPGTGCVWSSAARARQCNKSSCSRDDDCGSGSVCRVMNDATTAPAISACIPVGNRTRGESCSAFTPVDDTACAEELFCVFSVCGPRCDPAVPRASSGCREEENCVRSSREDVAICMPNCEKTGCPAGQSCLPLGGLSKCVVRHGEDCMRNACPDGQSCQVSIQAGQASFQCRRRCDPIAGTGCSEGELCGAGSATASYCYVKCDPKAATQGCRMDQSCMSVSEDGALFGCR